MSAIRPPFDCVKLKFIIKFSYIFGNVNTFREI